ncbi:thionin-like protein 2 [Cucurbita moschata]|uniref:Thionin-like protein 2 n=1 Tax=Cucurbita moschata TaxID=3662 RepID=A0A6J1GMH5_CUCMO|nr:thionin-like protein 2 [Cucurbita moschata]XP_022953261.1 thionin-like protein 2 [Cucurbita moschata]
MESCKAKLGLMAWLVLSSLTTANSTSFQECYATCFVICAITPGVAFSDCPLRCLQACIIPSFPIHNAAADDDVHRQQKNQFFCELGCAASSCTKFSTHQNPAEKKVGSCVDSCSRTCSMD